MLLVLAASPDPDPCLCTLDPEQGGGAVRCCSSEGVVTVADAGEVPSVGVAVVLAVVRTDAGACSTSILFPEVESPGEDGDA